MVQIRSLGAIFAPASSASSTKKVTAEGIQARVDNLKDMICTFVDSHQFNLKKIGEAKNLKDRFFSRSLADRIANYIQAQLSQNPDFQKEMNQLKKDSKAEYETVKANFKQRALLVEARNQPKKESVATVVVTNTQVAQSEEELEIERRIAALALSPEEAEEIAAAEKYADSHTGY